MLYLLDTANIEEIRKGNDLYPISGVTTNPSIIAKQKRPFFEIMKDIRSVIGSEKMLHAQAVGKTAEDIIREAECLNEKVGGNVYVKIPVFNEGIKAIKLLTARNIKTTATAIFTPQQALMAAEAGAEFLAPYINRADDICSDASVIVAEMVEVLHVGGLSHVNILGASFKNAIQVHQTILAGAKSVTVNFGILERLLYHPYTDWSINKFDEEWQVVYGNKLVTEIQ